VHLWQRDKVYDRNIIHGSFPDNSKITERTET
jgi:hypothetical protein